jgi:hypothetical protein
MICDGRISRPMLVIRYLAGYDPGWGSRSAVWRLATTWAVNRQLGSSPPAAKQEIGMGEPE